MNKKIPVFFYFDTKYKSLNSMLNMFIGCCVEQMANSFDTLDDNIFFKEQIKLFLENINFINNTDFYWRDSIKIDHELYNKMWDEIQSVQKILREYLVNNKGYIDEMEQISFGQFF